VNATTFVVRELPYLFDVGAILWLVELRRSRQPCSARYQGKCPYTKGFQ
jgi:hypothetical protein